MKMHQFCTISLVISLFTFTAKGQVSDEVHYYRQQYAKNETIPGFAKYAKHIRHNVDQSVTTEWVYIPNNAVVESQSYLRGIPVGLWITGTKRGKVIESLDYRFELKYTSDSCHSGYRFNLGRDSLAQYVSGKFSPPKLKDYKSLTDYLIKTLRYSGPSREAGIEGKVVLTMKLSKEGKLIDIMVLKSADGVLDAEAVRVLHFAPEWEPATLDGQPIELCMTFPLTFKLD